MVKRVHSISLVDRLLDLKYDYSDIMNPVPRGPGVKHTMGRHLYDNEHTSDCVFMSCGGAIQAVEAVMKDRVKTAFANIRPPGHHASNQDIGGFCFINNAAVAARYALDDLGANKVIVFDWDVHHGNGTQDIFQDDERVMYLSIHRYDNGGYYPYMCKSSGEYFGVGEGKGFSFNVGWNTEEIGKESLIGDGDYKLAFDNVIWPLAESFNPDLIIVSAGFDAMKEDPLGKLSVSENVYAYMTKQLMTCGEGKLVLLLEGGYNLETMSRGAVTCIKTLLGQPIGVDLETYDPVFSELGFEAVQTTNKVVKEYWDIPELEI